MENNQLKIGIKMKDNQIDKLQKELDYYQNVDGIKQKLFELITYKNESN